ncbi:NADH-quinone oxidoreductase subunit N [Orbaceae bacterium ac157xtp]
MMPITTHQLIYLLPIVILGFAIVILLFLLLLRRINTRFSAFFVVISLTLALFSSVFIGYKIINQPQQENAVTVSTEQPVVTNDAEKGIAAAINTDSTTAEKERHNQEQTEAGIISEQVLHPDETKTSAESLESTSTAEEPMWIPTYVTALFTADGYGCLYTSLILLISIVVTTLSLSWFKQEENNQGLFYLMVLLAALGSVISVYSSHLISLFIGIELLSISIVGLIGFQFKQRYTLEAAVKYMVLSAISTAFLLLGIAFYYAGTGELTFSGLSFQLSTLSQPSTLLLTGVCLMLVGIGFKLSLVPFQLWLPDVYQGAPACVSLLLTTGCKLAIFCAVARLFLLAPIVNNETIRVIMVIMSFSSIIWGNVVAINQTNIKRLLAFSSITHFGYLLVTLIAVQYQVLAVETIGVYLIGYVLANVCILGVISLESQSKESHDQDSQLELSGLFWRRPIIALAMGVGLLSLAGIPLTLGFFGRFSLILLAVTAELWWLVGIIVVGSALGLYLYLRLTINLYIKPNNYSKPVQNNSKRSIKELGINEVFIVTSALLIIFCGIYPKWIFNLVTAAQYLMPQ